MKTESLWEFLAALPFSFDAQVFYAMMLAGTAGMLANWVVRWAKGELPCLATYLFKINPRRSLLAFITYIGTALTAVMSGVFMSDASAMGEVAGCVVEDGTKHFVGWLNVLWSGAGTGFAIDATMNKGERQEWTAEERAKRVRSE